MSTCKGSTPSMRTSRRRNVGTLSAVWRNPNVVAFDALRVRLATTGSSFHAPLSWISPVEPAMTGIDHRNHATVSLCWARR